MLVPASIKFSVIFLISTGLRPASRHCTKTSLRDELPTNDKVELVKPTFAVSLARNPPVLLALLTGSPAPKFMSIPNVGILHLIAAVSTEQVNSTTSLGHITPCGKPVNERTSPSTYYDTHTC